MKYRYLDISPWYGRLLVVYGFPKDKTLELISRHKMGRTIRAQFIATPPSKGYEEAIVYMDGNHFLLYAHQKLSTRTIIHETNHIVKELMKYIGAQQEKEAHAYTQEWLYGEIKKLNT